MTAGLKEYILSVTAAAMICSSLPALIPEGSARSAVRLICGVLLTMAVLSPLSRLDISATDLTGFGLSMDSAEAVKKGSDMYLHSRNDIISGQLEAYILEKAESLAITVRPEVFLDSQGIPISCVIRSDCSDAERSLLEAVIETELGIAKENQQWVG